MKWNESGFRPPLCTYRLNWARRTSWGWWDDWDDTVLQTQDSNFEPWRSEAEHATSRSRRLPTILTFTRGWGRNNFVSFKPPRPGTEPRTLAWKAAVLTTTLGPPPYHLHVWSRVAVDLVHSEMTFTDLGKLREVSCQIPRARFAIGHVCPVSPWDPQRDPLSSGKWNRGQSTRSDTQLCCAANCELDDRYTKHGAPSPAQRWANRRRRWPIAVPALVHRPVFPDSGFNCHPPPFPGRHNQHQIWIDGAPLKCLCVQSALSMFYRRVPRRLSWIRSSTHC